MSTLTETDCLLSKIEFSKTNSFSSAFLDYISDHSVLKPFHNGIPTKESLRKQIDQRNFPKSHRHIIADVLQNQYEGLECSELTLQNIQALKASKTFTITTGHQLNIFTGPLYFIYKIATVIKACEELQAAYPEYNFVPVYWMATEDHDFDEIDHFRLNGKKLIWETNQKGAVGRFNLKGINSIFEQVIGMPQFFVDAYKKKTLAEAVRYYVNALFGEKGIVVIDADNAQLKSLFKPVIISDLFEHKPQQIAQKTSNSLEEAGYSTQVFPREINFFYLKDAIRSRIVKTDSGYEVLDTDIQFTNIELKAEIDSNPERFSPNVLLRPLYQEFLLPNLAYVGGPSELVYWLQLKDIFDHFDTAFPLLMPRNFAAVLDKNTMRKVEQTKLSWEELFMDEHQLVNQKVKEQTSFKLDLAEQKEKLQALFNDAHQQAVEIDQTLDKMVKAEHRRAEKTLEKVEQKILKAERRNQEILVNRIYAIKEALFPGGTPQERKDNFLNFYMTDSAFVERCMEAFDPFDYRFHLLKTNE
ncbi:MAG TPA: bacillithiol biosynthesis cysteine-adding enzyme BshC [Roseivirga sp.]